MKLLFLELQMRLDCLSDNIFGLNYRRKGSPLHIGLMQDQSIMATGRSVALRPLVPGAPVRIEPVTS